jgi:hypothetical protein
LTSAVSTQDWPGEAAVDVSIVNWVREPGSIPARPVLDGVEVEGISTSLRPSAAADLSSAEPLAANARRAFIGQYVRGRGYVLERDEAISVLAEAGVRYRDVIRPFLNADDVVRDPQQAPTRFVLDFGARTLEEAMKYPKALDLVRKRAKPERDRLAPGADYWWRHWRPRPEMRKAVRSLSRFIVGTGTSKRIFFAWCDPWTCPSHAVNVFAFESDDAMGVLSSRLHTEWARQQSSTLEDRIRYTPSSAFETFPWPSGNRDAVADVARRLYARRSEICLERNIGLTKLYNQMEDGAWAELRELHRELDEAVAAAYGWPASVAHDSGESNRRLLELNQAIAAGEVDYASFEAENRAG